MNSTLKLWNKYLNDDPFLNPDVIISINQTTIYNYLKKHWEQHKDEYKIKKKITVGKKNVNISISALTEILVDIYPYKDINKNLGYFNKSTEPVQWEVLPENFHPVMPFEYSNFDNKSLEIGCKIIEAEITISEAKNEPIYFKAKYSMLGQAMVNIGNMDNIYYLEVIPQKIAISSLELDEEIKKGNYYNSDIGTIAQELLAIIVNLLSKEYTPDLIFRLKIPIFQNDIIKLSLRKIISKDNMITSFFRINEEQTKINIQNASDEISKISEAKLLEDLKTIYKSKKSQDHKINFENLEKTIPNTIKYFNSHFFDYGEMNNRSSYPDFELLKNRISIGIEEKAIKKIINLTIPKDKIKEEKVNLKLIKGSYSLKVLFFEPEINVENSTLIGKIKVDVSANLQACYKKVVDCSWRWICGDDVGLKIKAAPEVILKSIFTGDEIIISAELKYDEIDFDFNLGSPYKEIFGFFYVSMVTFVISSMLYLKAVFQYIPFVKTNIDFINEKIKFKITNPSFDQLTYNYPIGINKAKYITISGSVECDELNMDDFEVSD
ncbi:MAG: hypothetical protein MJB14_11740 [Spirochaetes bacterium]|nr:hypothetical protein [Spirochaetota bacterium]